MQCQNDDVSCLLDVLIQQGQQGPSWLDIVGGIIVPLVLGIASVVLGLASWRTAQQSHLLNLRLAAAAAAKAAADERQELAKALLGWANWRWAMNSNLRGMYGADRYNLRRISISAGARDVPFRTLVDNLKSLDDLPIIFPFEAPQHFAAGRILGTSIGAIETWSSNPERYLTMQNLVPELVAELGLDDDAEAQEGR